MKFVHFCSIAVAVSFNRHDAEFKLKRKKIFKSPAIAVVLGKPEPTVWSLWAGAVRLCGSAC